MSSSKAGKPSISPGILSVPRMTTFFASLLVSLCSGTNHAYSAYAPQLGARLGLTHTRLNVLGLAGNVGIFGVGPIWGRIVDSRGPRILLFCAFIFQLIGYTGILHTFNSGVPPGAVTISDLNFCLLVFAGFLTGAGGNGGLQSALNATAKTFPDHARGTATGIVNSGFGLSAFLFSTAARMLFPGRAATLSLLRLLTYGTALPMVIGYFLVKPVPLLPFDGPHPSGPDLVESGAVDRRQASEVAGLLGQASTSYDTIRPEPYIASTTIPNVYGKSLFSSGRFWVLTIIMSILVGTGLTYVNNVGTMSQVLYFASREGGAYDPVKAAAWQASQVSAFSLMNFLARIVMGIISDFAKTRLHLPRSSNLILVSSISFLAQVLTANIDTVESLHFASALSGFAFGSAFSLLPMVCLEWFGLPHFSENWGFVSVSPIVGGQVFSIAFGKNMDAHEKALSLSWDVKEHVPTCHVGRTCYADTLYLTSGACFLSMMLSIYAGWHEWKHRQVQGSTRTA